MNAIAVVLITAGLVFMTISALGLVRFPDFFSRAHVVAKSETFGIILVIVGVVVQNRFEGGSMRLGLLVVFAAIANPTAIHALARAAYNDHGPTPESLDFPIDDPSDDEPGLQPGSPEERHRSHDDQGSTDDQGPTGDREATT